MQSSLPTLRPYPWNPPMTCIYTGHPSACSLSSLPRPWSCWGFSPVFNGSTRRNVGRDLPLQLRWEKKHQRRYEFFSEIFRIILYTPAGFLFRDMKYQDDSNKNILVYSSLWVFLETKSFRGHFSSHPPKIWHQPPGKKSLTETGFIGKTWKICGHYHGLIQWPFWLCHSLEFEGFHADDSARGFLGEKVAPCHGPFLLGKSPGSVENVFQD